MATSVVSCAPSGPTVPPITPEPTGEYHPGKFVWYDLLTEDLDRAKRFYGELLGWEFEDEPDDDYATVLLRGRPIGGMAVVERREESSISQWVSWLSVPDVDEAVQRAESAGADILRGPEELEGRGRFAVLTDPQGALLALVRSATGDPADREPDYGSWFWTELWTDDVPAATSFYDNLTQWERSTAGEAVLEDYIVFRREDRPRAGVIEIEWEGVRPHWLPYIRVRDPAAIAARVESLGGRVVLEPSPDIRNGSVGLVLDPSGAVFAIQQWPVEQGGGI
jgi:hypothetical protein